VGVSIGSVYGPFCVLGRNLHFQLLLDLGPCCHAIMILVVDVSWWLK